MPAHQASDYPNKQTAPILLGAAACRKSIFPGLSRSRQMLGTHTAASLCACCPLLSDIVSDFWGNCTNIVFVAVVATLTTQMCLYRQPETAVLMNCRYIYSSCPLISFVNTLSRSKLPPENPSISLIALQNATLACANTARTQRADLTRAMR